MIVSSKLRCPLDNIGTVYETDWNYSRRAHDGHENGGAPSANNAKADAVREFMNSPPLYPITGNNFNGFNRSTVGNVVYEGRSTKSTPGTHQQGPNANSDIATVDSSQFLPPPDIASGDRGWTLNNNAIVNPLTTLAGIPPHLQNSMNLKFMTRRHGGRRKTFLRKRSQKRKKTKRKR